MEPLKVTACLVTRGNVPMTTIVASLPAGWAVRIYDNSLQTGDLSVYGRYVAIREAQTDVVFTQDDDCLLPAESFQQLIQEYVPGRLTTNMPGPFRAHYSDSCLLGFGAIFDRDLPALAFSRLPSRPQDFERTCDVYFTALSPNQAWLDLPYRDLPWARGPDRMYRQVDHVGSRAKALEHARKLR